MENIKFWVYNPASKSILKDVENVFQCLSQQLVQDKAQPTRGFTLPYDHKADGMVWLMGSGIMDIKDVEVFSGHVLKCPKGINDVVEFKHGAFWLKHRNITLHKFMFDLGNAVEIIGVVHVNPELAELNRI